MTKTENKEIIYNSFHKILVTSRGIYGNRIMVAERHTVVGEV